MPDNRKPVDIRADLLDQAHDLNIDASLVAERALFHKIREQRSEAERAEMERKWKEENAEAFSYSNDYVERNGLPLAKYRQF